MIKRLLEISSGPAHLSVRHRQLVIEPADGPPVQVPCEDIGVVLVDHPAVTYTHGVFNRLAEVGAVVVACGNNHLPQGVWLPLAGNTLIGERSRTQLALPTPLKKRLWQTVVMAKLQQQAHVLHAVNGDDGGLNAMAQRVRSGDVDNREGAAARRYWSALFGKGFIRGREGPQPNPLLNYGYTVLRAAMARALCGAGLMTVMGIHHHDRANAFALADDLMEPYRPLLDYLVKQWLAEREEDDELTTDDKRALLSLLVKDVQLGNEKTTVLLALHATATSYWAAISGRRPNALRLPTGLPIEHTERGDSDADDLSTVENGVGLRDV